MTVSIPGDMCVLISQLISQLISVCRSVRDDLNVLICVC
jgi:hypothetical protein